jgi:DNA sulfur modification protein DndD
VAQNGVGKTNILNAITWCLYGKEPHLGDETKERGLPKLNLQALDEARKVGHDKVNVEVTISAKDGLDLITYHRRLPVRISPEIFEFREEFTVSVSIPNGDTEIFQDDAANQHVNKYMPETIKEYFYFDGEQLNNYFISGKRERIKEAIFSISQVDMVSRIHQRIGEMITAKQKEAGAKAPDIKTITSKLEECKGQIGRLEEGISEIESQIAVSDRIISDNTDYLSGQDNLPELEASYQKLRGKQTQLEIELTRLMQRMYVFVRELKVAITFYPAAKKALDIIAQKEASKSLPPNIDKALLIEMLSLHKCTICDHDLNPSDEKHIQQLVDRFQLSSAASNVLTGIRSELDRIVATVMAYPEEKKAIIKSKQTLEGQIKENERELQEIDNKISRFSDKEDIRHKHQERAEHEALKTTNLQKLGSTKQRMVEAQNTYETLSADLKKSMAKVAECQRIQQLIEFSERGRDIVGSIQEEMMHEVREKMEKRTSAYFTRLVWKKNTYDRIVLNDDYQLDLIHKDGYSCVGTCSAAERCLLALSFTLALHEVSGFNSLLFIDTPVARVSDLNRINFAEVLRDVSMGKQIIMTFTPDEYSTEIRNVFDTTASTNVGLYMVNEKVTVVK